MEYAQAPVLEPGLGLEPGSEAQDRLPTPHFPLIAGWVCVRDLWAT